jgi:hypothetical protein
LLFGQNPVIIIPLFGAVVSATQIVAVLPTAILIFTLLEFLGNKWKGDRMENDSTSNNLTVIKTKTTKWLNYIRKSTGHFLVKTSVIGSSTTAAVAGHQL